MKKTLTEVLPKNHVCSWQVIETRKDGKKVLACTHPDCNKTKVVEAPKEHVSESGRSKKLLLG